LTSLLSCAAADFAAAYACAIADSMSARAAARIRARSSAVLSGIGCCRRGLGAGGVDRGLNLGLRLGAQLGLVLRADAVAAGADGGVEHLREGELLWRFTATTPAGGTVSGFLRLTEPGGAEPGLTNLQMFLEDPSGKTQWLGDLPLTIR
jgi:hypothetical protein